MSDYILSTKNSQQRFLRIRKSIGNLTNTSETFINTCRVRLCNSCYLIFRLPYKISRNGLHRSSSKHYSLSHFYPPPYFPMKLVTSSDKTREDKQGYSKKILLDANDLNSPWNIIQMIKIKAWDIAKLHHHKIQTEIFYLLDEHGYRIINGEEIHPKMGDVLVIEPNDTHEVISSDTHDYTYLAIKFNHDQNDFYRD